MREGRESKMERERMRERRGEEKEVRLSDTRCTGWQFSHLVSEEGEQSRNMAVPQCIPTLPVLRIEVLLQRFLRDRKKREEGERGERGRRLRKKIGKERWKGRGKSTEKVD